MTQAPGHLPLVQVRPHPPGELPYRYPREFLGTTQADEPNWGLFLVRLWTYAGLTILGLVRGPLALAAAGPGLPLAGWHLGGTVNRDGPAWPADAAHTSRFWNCADRGTAPCHPAWAFIAFPVSPRGDLQHHAPMVNESESANPITSFHPSAALADRHPGSSITRFFLSPSPLATLGAAGDSGAWTRGLFDERSVSMRGPI